MRPKVCGQLLHKLTSILQVIINNNVTQTACVTSPRANELQADVMMVESKLSQRPLFTTVFSICQRWMKPLDVFNKTCL